MYVVCILLAVASLGVLLSPTLATDTVPELNVSQYVGRWYEVYGDDNADLFQNNASCITADYSLLPNNSVTVQNTGRLKTPDGELFQIKGFAYRPDDKEQGKLKVHLFGVPREGDYWVIQIGPPTYKENFYQYSVVTDASNLNLFVLARNATQFKENYEATVLDKLEQQGFNKFELREVFQGNDCEYGSSDCQSTFWCVYNGLNIMSMCVCAFTAMYMLHV